MRFFLKVLGLSALLGGVVDATTAAQRWSQGAAAAQTRYTEGIQSTTKDPTALAAAASAKMLANVTQAVSSGSWAQRLLDVGANGWKQASIAKAANYGTGIAAGTSKYQQGYTAFWNYATPLLNQVHSMPSNTLADSIARMTTWVQGTAAYRKP